MYRKIVMFRSEVLLHLRACTCTVHVDIPSTCSYVHVDLTAYVQYVHLHIMHVHEAFIVHVHQLLHSSKLI